MVDSSLFLVLLAATTQYVLVEPRLGEKGSKIGGFCGMVEYSDSRWIYLFWKECINVTSVRLLLSVFRFRHIDDLCSDLVTKITCQVV